MAEPLNDDYSFSWQRLARSQGSIEAPQAAHLIRTSIKLAFNITENTHNKPRLFVALSHCCLSGIETRRPFGREEETHYDCLSCKKSSPYPYTTLVLRNTQSLIEFFESLDYELEASLLAVQVQSLPDLIYTRALKRRARREA